MINLGHEITLQSEVLGEAIKVFEENGKRHPGSPNVYDSLSEACETNGQLNLAKKNYKKAYDLAKKQDH